MILSRVWAGAAALALGEGLGLPSAWRPWVWLVLGAAWLREGLSFPAWLLVALGVVSMWPDRSGQAIERWALCRFWQRVAVLASAGLNVLEAVEEASPSGILGVRIRSLVEGTAGGRPEAGERFIQSYNYPEARMIVQALEGAWRHGLDPEAAFAQAQNALTRLAHEARARAASAPLWSTFLPAALLFSLLIMIMVPLAGAAWAGWAHL